MPTEPMQRRAARPTAARRIERPRLRDAALKAVEEASKHGKPGYFLLRQRWTAKELREHGITAAHLKKIRCSCTSVIALGYTLQEIMEAGYSPSQITEHFTARDFLEVGMDTKKLKKNGFEPLVLLRAGFTQKEILEAGFDAEAVKYAVNVLVELRKARKPEGIYTAR